MASRVYIETSFVSYLTARPSRDLIIAAHQQVTHEWWDRSRAAYELYTSELTVLEAGRGDTIAAKERTEALAAMTVLGVTPEAQSLAEEIVAVGALPAKAGADALHIAIAAVQGVEYLLTWNCKHLANAAIRRQIEAACASAGHEAPIICTPDELMGE